MHTSFTRDGCGHAHSIASICLIEWNTKKKKSEFEAVYIQLISKTNKIAPIIY